MSGQDLHFDERLKSRGRGQVTVHQETRDPQLACIFLSFPIFVLAEQIS